MELINQHTKAIMEGCKERAREAGLSFQNETLEYIVTNKDLLDLGPKNMIPTLYDYWVHDVEVLKERGKYELFPYNPYETVINTRPAMSFYNDNNPDWLNVMIFYHVLAHIDFFQNNYLFAHTWHDDFAGRALSDKRTIAMLRSEKGHWVDYVIEFARGIDNIVSFFDDLTALNRANVAGISAKLDFYFDYFLQSVKKAALSVYMKEIERYNSTVDAYGPMAESAFFAQVIKQYPEFEAMFEKHRRETKAKPRDLFQFLQENSPFLNRNENQWMKTVMEIVRHTSLYFQPQMRTNIMNEGWASYWHDRLFLQDDRIRGHEVSYARVNAWVTALPKLGLNSYALGMRVFEHLKENADKGKISYDYQRLTNKEKRRHYNREAGNGQAVLLSVRENFGDFNFVNTFIDQEFMDRYKLFVASRRMNGAKGVWEYYIKSRKAEDYRQMLLSSLYHPPSMMIDEAKCTGGCLYLNHEFEGKPLVREYLANTMLGIEYLWGGPVKLETSEPVEEQDQGIRDIAYLFYSAKPVKADTPKEKKYRFQRVVYTMENRQLSMEAL